LTAGALGRRMPPVGSLFLLSRPRARRMLGTTCRTTAFHGERPRGPEGLAFFESIISGVVGGLFGGGQKEEKQKAPPPPTGPKLEQWALGLGAFVLVVFVLRGPRA
jgi:hypothetical protein